MLLTDFHPACRHWFEATFGQPTPTQVKAWAAIRAGRHTLISAPTGSGKTLAAFYAVIDALVQRGLGGSAVDGVQILYVSPLKALSNDIHRNLELPLQGIAEHLQRSGEPPVDIAMAVRTGDTPAAERRKMAKNPPHILVTTPESLYLLLTSVSGRNMLSGVSTLIVDEIHAMLGDKRGSHLALSVERLEHLVRSHGGRPLQRIGLSATQKPIDLVASYLVGNRGGAGHDATGATGATCDCEIVDAGFRRELDLSIEVPASPLSALMSNEVWGELHRRLVELIESHDTTLVFVNTRRLSERLALALEERLGEGLVCSHHGAMGRERRHEAEQRLKAGKLKVLVATASMELGIDIGSVDLVVQFASPRSIATFLQRVGRSGHSIDGTPKGVLFPLSRDDLVESAALLHSIRQGELDRIVMPEQPLDVLAQQIVAEVSSGEDGVDGMPAAWDLDELHALCIRAWPYRCLSRKDFDGVVAMLAEGYSSRRGRRGARLHLDAIHNKVRGRRGGRLIALTNGGAIPDMFEYQVVLDPEDLVVGSLNEDFALEALPGDVFTLGTHAWQLLRIDGLRVRVRDATGSQPTIPFWFGEAPGRTRELSEAVSALRTTMAGLLQDESSDAATRWATEAIGLSGSAATQMVEYLQSGMQALGVMPTRETLVMERFFDEVGDMHVVIHAPFGSRLNRGWGLALRKRFCRTFNFELQAAANENSIVISLGAVHSFPLDEVYRYLQSASVREVLIQAMLDAPMFEVRWRWNATRSLAIQRNRNGSRTPPQFQRMDAEDLIAHVFPDQIACQENLGGAREVPDHPLVNQTVHDCLTEAMDVEELQELIGAIESDRLTLIAKDLREPSPFAQEIINARPYAFLDDAPFEERRTNAIRNRSWADPAEARDFSLLDADAIQRVRDEAWPLVANPEELHDALLSLAWITDREFAERDYRRWQEPLLAAGRIRQIDHGGRSLWVATENLPLFDAALGLCLTPAALQGARWQPETAMQGLVRGRLEGLGPVTAASLAAEIGVRPGLVEQALIALEAEGFAFRGQFTPASKRQETTGGAGATAVEWCERRLLQRIHRYTIDAHRKAIKPVSLESYTAFLFDRHRLLPLANGDGSATMDGQTGLENTLKLLDGIAAPAANWEADIYPARIEDYDPNWLNVFCVNGKVTWGRYRLPDGRHHEAGRRNLVGPVRSSPITIALRENLDIWQALAGQSSADGAETPTYSALATRIEQDLEQHGASFLDQIQRRTGLLTSQLEDGLGELVCQGRVSSDSFTGLRALLTPAHRKTSSRRRAGRSAMFGVADAGRWSLLDTFRVRESESTDNPAAGLDEGQMERLVGIYLRRWGVLIRQVLERESLAPPWRVLLNVLRRMELRGELRGGRFVAGVGGEQFALPETVDEIRRFSRTRNEDATPPFYCLAAGDPLNLLNLVLPNRKLPRLRNNRVLYQAGVPVAVLDSGEVRFLREVKAEERWSLQQMLRKRRFPGHLRAYLGVT